MNNLAYKIAVAANRIVLAPTGPAYISKIIFTSYDPVEVSHQDPECIVFNQNLFKTFTPPGFSHPHH